MKNGPLFFLGLLAALGISWGAIVLGSNAQLGGLTPYFDESDGQMYPGRFGGIAQQGQLVYADLGCASCHTQQVRRPGFGADQDRGWGERQSVARDYVFQMRPQLGAMRLGPDLANLGGRKPNPPQAEDLLKLLYLGGPNHPSYKFLFDERSMGESSSEALDLPREEAPKDGHQIVPTARARSLVTYLLSLDTTYVYPEARPVPPPPAGGEHAAKAAPAAPKEKPIPAAAPDEKKKDAEPKKNEEPKK